jgi:hypothetical protein
MPVSNGSTTVREVRSMQAFLSLQHPYLVKANAVWSVPGYIVINMELAEATLLDLMLGQVPGFVSVGELRQIWQRGLVEDSRCGCRLAFHECPYWTAVGLAAFGGWDRLDLAAVLELRNSLDRVSTLRTLKRPGSRPQEEARIEAYVSILENLLRGIQEVSGAGVIVDSSKTPSHALLLARVPDVDLRLIHLVRDSRGVAYSWKRATRGKQRKRKLRSLRARLGVNLSASMRWASYNARIPTLTHVGIPYRFVRYEDMVGDPRTCLPGARESCTCRRSTACASTVRVRSSGAFPTLRASPCSYRSGS